MIEKRMQAQSTVSRHLLLIKHVMFSMVFMGTLIGLYASAWQDVLTPFSWLGFTYCAGYVLYLKFQQKRSDKESSPIHSQIVKQRKVVKFPREIARKER